MVFLDGNMSTTDYINELEETVKDRLEYLRQIEQEDYPLESLSKIGNYSLTTALKGDRNMFRLDGDTQKYFTPSTLFSHLKSVKFGLDESKLSDSALECTLIKLNAEIKAIPRPINAI